METRPSKEEILEKYRDVIDAEDFQVLYESIFPTPEAARQENAFFQYLGKIKGWSVWKKLAVSTVTVICFVGDFEGGLQAIGKWGHFGYDQIAHYVELGLENCEKPATEYVLFDKPNNWPLAPDEPILLAITTTTTTTTPPPDTAITIPSGTGIAPNSDDWVS